jgi:hypothetical protein
MALPEPYIMEWLSFGSQSESVGEGGFNVRTAAGQNNPDHDDGIHKISSYILDLVSQSILVLD